MNKEQLLEEIERLKLKIISLKKLDSTNSNFSEDLHNSVVESAPDAIISINSRGNIIYWNKSAERLFGFSKYEILGSSLTKIIPRRFRNDHIEGLNRALTSSISKIKGKAMQLIGLHKYGKEFPIEITLSTGFTDNMRYFTGIIRDTTERFESQRLIKESQELYSLLVNNANDGIYITTPEYLEFVNPAFERFSGYKFEEVCNENFNIINLIHPDDHELVQQRTKDRKAGKEIKSRYEFKFVTKSGVVKFVEVNTVPLPDKKGKVLGMLRDITDRKIVEKKLEETLDKNEIKYKTLMDTLNDGIGQLDNTGKIIFGNKQLFQMIGYSEKELIGKFIGDLFPEDIRSEMLVQIASRKTGKESSYESELLRKDGIRLPVLISPKAMFDENNDFIGSTAVISDISRIKMSERELEFTMDQLSLILDSQPVVTYLSRTEGDFGATYISNGVVEMTGYRPEEFISNSTFWSSNIHPDDVERVFAELPKLFENGVHEHEYRWKIKNGTYRWFFDSLKLVKDKNAHSTHIVGMWQDITERKKSEKQVQESEVKFRSLFDRAQDAIFILSDNSIIDCNKTALKLLGYGKEEILKMTPYYFSPKRQPDGKSSKKEALRRIQLTMNGAPQLFEWQLTDKDGNLIDTEIITSRIDIEGNSYIQALVRDIRQRKESERLLMKSEQNYKTLVETMSDGLIRLDSKANIIFANKKLLSMLGYSKEELLSKNVSELLRKENQEQFAEEISRRKRGENEPFETEFTRKDGKHISVIVSPETIYDKSGVFIGAVGVITDITDIRNMTTKLKESISVLKSTMDATYDAIFVVDNDQHPIYYNQKFLTMMGFTEKNIGKSKFKDRMKSVVHLFIDPKQFKNKIEYFRKNPHKKGFDLLEFVDGRVFERYSMPRKIDGKIVGRIWSFKDVTDTKNEEQKRLAAEQRLETAKRMESLGVLAGGVAHDLNNILGPMVAYPDLLASELPEDSPMLEDLAIIKDSAVSAAEVVSDLLTLARRGNYKMQPLSLNDVFRSYRKSLAHHSFQDLFPNVRLTTYLSSKLHNINGSASHLSKVVMNMVNNAYEAMQYGGTLEIKTYNKTLEKQLLFNDEIPKGHYVVIEFKDNGVGMNEDEMSKIFEPFFSKKEMGRSGSGLGLSVVWGVVKDHKGYIDITSEEGVGTKFSLYFPATRKKQNGTTNHLSSIRGSETIIVIDDEKKQRDVARKVLSSLGYEVKCFESGAKGINYLKKNDAALIILDMVMKNEDDGLRIYRRILKTDPTLKTIIVSGFSETEYVREAKKLGVKSFIKKPFTVESLGKTVRTILDK
ncbi:MAG: PAS domain S-box protein [Candidatus Marinimicrobia bacterium]|nr:PAS domain S-box protein [Candidatus Neomarinimicrobiota bacterium]